MIDLELPKRKHTRLKNYDYSQNGLYFVTFCVKDDKPLLGEVIVGRDAHILPQLKLSEMGKIADKYINNISSVYENIDVDKYIIMPNHIHMIISFDFPYEENGGMWASRPTLQTVVRSLKTMITKEIGYSIWQDSFYEHIIRNEKGYQEIWRYIDENLVKYQCCKLHDW